ncbi:unnamed protein product [Clavelina lepadiformis]|uniref:Transmembrane protein n=1 Tax=Clavelina lepadiformis TaxID=159417 RepID=A0ABP0GT21_CLALP
MNIGLALGLIKCVNRFQNHHLLLHTSVRNFSSLQSSFSYRHTLYFLNSGCTTYNSIKCLSQETPRLKRGKAGSLAVVIVPLTALIFVLWAFPYGGINLRRKTLPQQELPTPESTERLYESKVEKLRNERRLRQVLALEEERKNPEESL